MSIEKFKKQIIILEEENFPYLKIIIYVHFSPVLQMGLMQIVCTNKVGNEGVYKKIKNLI